MDLKETKELFDKSVSSYINLFREKHMLAEDEICYIGDDFYKVTIYSYSVLNIWDIIVDVSGIDIVKRIDRDNTYEETIHYVPSKNCIFEWIMTDYPDEDRMTYSKFAEAEYYRITAEENDNRELTVKEYADNIAKTIYDEHIELDTLKYLYFYMVNYCNNDERIENVNDYIKQNKASFIRIMESLKVIKKAFLKDHENYTPSIFIDLLKEMDDLMENLKELTSSEPDIKNIGFYNVFNMNSVAVHIKAIKDMLKYAQVIYR